MLDFRRVGEDLEGYRQRLGRRPTFDAQVLDVVQDRFLRRSSALTETQSLQAEKNRQNKEMQKVFRTGTPEDKERARAQQKALSNRIRELEEEADRLENELSDLMLAIPNEPDASVPFGHDESDNVVVRTCGARPTFDFEPRDHVTLAAEGWGLLDLESAAKLAGSRFAVMYGDLARLERALAHFMLDVHTQEHGYREVSVPFLANTASLTATGQLPKFADDQFRVPFNESTDYYLIPTAEVPLTNLLRDAIVGPDDALPQAYCAWTPCFRKEAGSAGRDTRGIMRHHQFHKVELVRFCHPERSDEEHELLVGHAESILQRLELHYRVSLLCTGDLSANAAKCYDLEVWLPGEDRYREISSCSNFGDYQARRGRIRFRQEAKAKPRLVHTLNGSGLAVGRTIIALLEQHQQADGSVRVPEALRPYLAGRDRLPSG